MIANVVVPKPRPSADIVNGETCDESAYESASIGKTVEEDVTEVLEFEAIMHVSVQVNSSLAGVMLDGTVSLVKYERIISL